MHSVSGGIAGIGHYAAQATLSNLYTVVYVVGKVAGDTQPSALYRFDLQPDGSWSPPQLLARNIGNLDAEYVFINKCRVEASSTANEEYFVSKAAFLDKKDAKGNDETLTPSGVQMRLTPLAVATVSNASETVTTAADLQPIVLNAAMRGADECTAS